jgi:hypothetical protein
MASRELQALTDGRFFDPATQTRYMHSSPGTIAAPTIEAGEHGPQLAYRPTYAPEQARFEGRTGPKSYREWELIGPYEPQGLRGQARIIRRDFDDNGRLEDTRISISNYPERTYRALERLARMTIGRSVSELDLYVEDA